jgi:predicted transcriptional regulator
MNNLYQYESVLFKPFLSEYNLRMDLKTRLKQLINERGLNPYTLAQIAKVPQPTVHRILSGESTSPRTSTVQKLAKGLGITEMELRGMDIKINLDEQQLLNDIRTLSQEHKELIINMVKSLKK